MKNTPNGKWGRCGFSITCHLNVRTLNILGRIHRHALLSRRVCMVTLSCLTLCDPMGCNLLGSPVPGISQAGKLEWVAIPFSRGSSQPRDGTRVSCISAHSLDSIPKHHLLSVSSLEGHLAFLTSKFMLVKGER